MDEVILNELLEFSELGFIVNEKIVESGQRCVYKASSSEDSNNDPFVLKTCPVFPTSVARIQRELKILKGLDSAFFPKSVHSQFVSNEKIQYFIDNINPKAEADKVSYVKKLELRPFFITVEEYIEHRDWNECAREFANNERILIEFLKKLFSGLNILWEEKIVHRDLKPDNILVNDKYEPVIIDLGIAKSMREGTKMLTHPFVSSPCTPQFASPEQLRDSKAEVTYKSDQFSVGVITFWILTGKFPFDEMNNIGAEQFIRNVLDNKINKIEDFNPNVSQKLRDFVYKLLSIEPYKRYRNFNAIIQHLENIGD